MSGEKSDFIYALNDKNNRKVQVRIWQHFNDLLLPKMKTQRDYLTKALKKINNKALYSWGEETANINYPSLEALGLQKQIK